MQVGKSFGKQQLKVTSTRVIHAGADGAKFEIDVMGQLKTPEGSGMHHGTYSFTVAHGEVFWPYTYNGITNFPSGHGAGLSGSGFAQRREDGKIVVRGVLRHAGVTDPDQQHLLQGLVIVEGIGDAVEHTLIGEGFEWL